jgi:hypothetical protein
MRHVALCGGGSTGDCCAAGVGVACGVFAPSPFDAHARHATRRRLSVSVIIFGRIVAVSVVQS